MNNGPQPFVTIILPIRNEGGFIARSLGAVLGQDYPAARIEVLVADGMSTDGTRAVVADLARTHPNVRLLDNPGKIVSTGLNRALPLARGDVIIRVDGHCEIAPDYVRRCVAHLLADGVDGVGGPIETVADTPAGATIALAMGSPFGVGGAAFRTIRDRALEVDTIAFPAYTRHAVELAGLYDEEQVRNQDDEYNYRLRARGARLLLAPDVRSRYYSRATVRGLARQYYQYGYWKVRVLQKHPRQMSARQFAPPLLVGALLGLGALAPWQQAARWGLAGVAAAYGLANGAASLWTARRAGWGHLPLLPLVFATLHGGYGLGFLVGLVRFWHHWRTTDDTTKLS